MGISLEEEVLSLFKDNKQKLTRKDIKNGIKKDPSSTIRDLIYFEYLIENDDQTLSKTDKKYDVCTRKNEFREIDYRFVLNKVFSGSYLEYNLGHEIINFIKDDKEKRYVYLNPLGQRGKKAKSTTKYVFHIIESTLNDENGIYELVGVSEINQKPTIDNYNKNIQQEILNSPKYKDFTYFDIFNCGSGTVKAHVYTYEASKFYRPKKRIIIKIGKKEASSHERNRNVEVNLMCNPQHSICYADASGKKTFSSQANEIKDVDVLKSVLDNYLNEDKENIDLTSIDDEQCFSVISGRAKLEVSTSNQIAYFLQRDHKLLYIFLHDFLNITDVVEGEKFVIVREKEDNIDLLFKSEKHVVVVENKIDSKINGVAKEPNTNGKYNSQLSKYYKYIDGKYKKSNKSYFVLAPEYNELSMNVYEHGDKYTLKTYNQFYEKFKGLEYRPNNNDASPEGKFLFSQFIKSIEYLTWSKGKQRERTAYIRLKQRINELQALKDFKN